MFGVSRRRTASSSTTARFRSPAASAPLNSFGFENVIVASTTPKISSRSSDDGVGVGAELGELRVGEGRVLLGQHPVRRALVERELPDVLGDLGHELHRARGTADHGHRLAGEVVVVIPPRRVEQRARERVEPGDVGFHRRAEHAERADDHVGLELVTGLEREAPHRPFVVPVRRAHGGAESQVRLEAELLDAPLEVGADLRLPGVRS